MYSAFRSWGNATVHSIRLSHKPAPALSSPVAIGDALLANEQTETARIFFDELIRDHTGIVQKEAKLKRMLIALSDKDIDKAISLYHGIVDPNQQTLDDFQFIATEELCSGLFAAGSYEHTWELIDKLTGSPRTSATINRLLSQMSRRTPEDVIHRVLRLAASETNIQSLNLNNLDLHT